MIKQIAIFVKIEIVLFVMMAVSIGYGVGINIEQTLSFLHLLVLLLGTFFLTCGSLGLNQVTEWRLDKLMDRTKNRPIPQGFLKRQTAYILSFANIFIGSVILFSLSPLTGIIGLTIIVLYNGLYTLYYKRRSPFAVVPGAVPGALPVVLGYSAINPDIFSSPCVYLFMLMFLWQMPHTSLLAIRFRKDYQQGGFPVLPLALGMDKTISFMAQYLFVYVALAIAAPLFVEVQVFYVILTIPFVFKLLWEFLRYYSSPTGPRWPKVFAWVNMSMPAFLIAALIDKWAIYTQAGSLFK